MPHQAVRVAADADATLRRLRQVCEDVAAARQQAAELTALRDALVVALAADGVSYAEVAGASGLTPGRVAQVVARARRGGD